MVGCGEKFAVYYKNGRERTLICGNSYKKVCPYNQPCLCRLCSIPKDNKRYEEIEKTFVKANNRLKRILLKLRGHTKPSFNSVLLVMFMSVAFYGGVVW